MQAIPSAFNVKRSPTPWPRPFTRKTLFCLMGLSLLLSPLLLSSCQNPKPQLRKLKIHQSWPLQVGSQVAGYPISSGLGDITLELAGDPIQMPFDGEIVPTQGNCVLLSGSEVPAYLFRLCGLRRAKLGQQSQSQVIGTANRLVFATLRKQTDGTWVLVEPSTRFIEQLLGE